MGNSNMKKTSTLESYEISEIIEMALSDHVSFNQIQKQYGLREDEVKKIMKTNLKAGSYKAWRQRIHEFSSRREYYK